MSEDITLLKAYLHDGSEQSFAVLVSRHINLVYSVALRRVADPHLAEDVTQKVFALLASKGPSLTNDTILPAWLCRTARNVSAEFLRAERRRQTRERKAIMEADTATSEETDWSGIAPLLDQALESLSAKDHDALVLRFLDDKKLKDVAVALGTSEDAARMRVNRALESLRDFLQCRGVAVSAGGLVASLAANATHAAPATLASSVLAAALAAGKTSASIAIGTTKVLAMTSLQKAAVSLTLTATLATALYEHGLAAHARVSEAALQTAHADLANQWHEAQAASSLLSNQLSALQEENSRLRSGAPQGELLKLRGEVATLRARLSETNPTRSHPTAVAFSTDAMPNDPVVQYLGAAVTPNINTNSAYTKEGLTDALQRAAAAAEVTLRSLTVDDSEFPPILGVKCDTTEAGKTAAGASQAARLPIFRRRGQPRRYSLQSRSLSFYASGCPAANDPPGDGSTGYAV